MFGRIAGNIVDILSRLDAGVELIVEIRPYDERRWAQVDIVQVIGLVLNKLFENEPNLTL